VHASDILTLLLHLVALENDIRYRALDGTQGEENMELSGMPRTSRGLASIAVKGRGYGEG
jgi:hypothetical protein